MDFNIEKCKVLHVGGRNQNFNYKMRGSELNSVTDQKDLGIIVNNKFKFNKQCIAACKKANRALSYIFHNFEYKSRKVIIPLYKSFVRPSLDFGAQFWNSHTA